MSISGGYNQEDNHSDQATVVQVGGEAISTTGAITSMATGGSGPIVFPGYITLNRDLERDLKAKFGDKIILHGIGEYVFADRMPAKWHRKVDVHYPTVKQCRQFGVKRTHITRR